MKLQNLELKRICRKAGGLYLGLRIHFPVRMCDETNFTRHWTCIMVSAGFLFWQLSFDLSYGFQTEELPVACGEPCQHCGVGCSLLHYKLPDGTQFPSCHICLACALESTEKTK